MDLLILRLKKLFYVLLRPSLWQYASRGVFPSVEHSQVVDVMLADKNIDCLLDIGFNKGQFCLLTLEKNPRIKVIAFDPHPHSSGFFRRLKKSFSKRSAGLYFFNYALASHDQNSLLNVPLEWDSASLLPPTSNQSAYFGTSRNYSELAVQCRKLDTIISTTSIQFNSAIVKIDVQGFEKEVLLGSLSIMPKFKYILIELSFVELYKEQPLALDIFDLIVSNGFGFIGAYNPSYNGIALVQADFCFERSD